MKKENNEKLSTEQEKDIENMTESKVSETEDDNLSDTDNEKANKNDIDDKLADLEGQIAESKDKYLRLYSEFENYRRRTAREKIELIDTASEGIMTELLPVLDDFERALKSTEDGSDEQSVREGLDLIYHKFKKILEQKGLKNMNSEIGEDFDPDFHEAITQIPAPEKKLKGKIVDVIEKGYLIKDKVIRYAKVVTGS
jgi:molecular chaperone GrpE